MLYGFLSDLHGSVIGLRQGLHALGKVDRLFYLGDVIGYHSQEGVDDCIERLKDLHAEGVRGNCEEYLGSRYRMVLRQESLDWIKELPQERRIDGDIYLCHGGPKNPLEERILSEETAWFNFKAGDFRLCFHGHTHGATLFVALGEEVERIPIRDGEEIPLEAAKRYIVGVGSAGAPRDSNRGSAVLFDTTRQTLRFLRF